MITRLRLSAVCTLCVLFALGTASAQMPDAKAMSGIPLPMAEMESGTISVRVVRGTMSNVISKQQVQLVADGQTKTATTDDSGRATFTGVTAGSAVKVRAVVGGETLESQEFRTPAQGGVRLILVASAGDSGSGQSTGAAKEPTPPAAPAQPGTVTLGSQSRIHIEFSEEAAEVYYLLNIVNPATAPVQPKTAFAFELPEDASGSAILQGSSPSATAVGRKITVRGPFAPGTTMVQAAFRLPSSGGRLAFAQTFPVPFDAPVLTVLKKVPTVSIGASSFHDPREVPNDGQVLLVAHAKAVSAGTPLSVRVDGVPSHPSWPRILALMLAALILGAGAWGAATAGGRVAERRAAAKQLESRREKLFAELAALEQRRRSGAIPESRYDRRRREIIEDLERVYGDLDEGAAA